MPPKQVLAKLTVLKNVEPKEQRAKDLYIYIYTHVCIYLSIYLSFYLSIYLSISLSLSLYLYIYIYQRLNDRQCMQVGRYKGTLHYRLFARTG